MRAVLAVFRHELRRIFTLRPVFSVFILAAAIYAVFYPQPYLTEALRNVPIVVVDRDGTSSSREMVRRLDATSDVSVALVLPDLPSAQRAVYERTVSGILLIPGNFERDLLHGRPSPVAFYADASYFLIYQRIAGAVSAVARTLGSEVESARLVAAGVDPALAGAVVDPMPLTAVPLFNPQGGYATYLLPAAFVLILQQLLLIGTGLLGTIPDPGPDPGPDPDWPRAGPLATVTGKYMAYLVPAALILPFYLIALPYLYGIPRLGSPATVLLFALPFVLAVCGLGLIAPAVFRTPLAVQLATAAVGLPFFFLAGFSWPQESMPDAVRLVARLLPSTSAIDGLVRVAQLGAPLSEVAEPFLTLWALAGLYGAIAVALAARRGAPAPRPGHVDRRR
ncbi:ABC transporter permease [Azospirillum sp. TSA6c]|uniref:ABC transporter permease n=1 Tax=unclassified Azospirillum TaxID=2630922 RepID=UPI000D6158D7|nr:ABC transporter permease [Azospirillum sp. TSA6c]PWC54096.1 ABC transporter permease [Azospirillum sp. TSA6c]